MMATKKTNTPNASVAQQNPQDRVQLSRTLHRIKRRLLLEQCGASLPYALQSTPQVLLRSSSQDSSDCIVGIGMSKMKSSSVGRVPPVVMEAISASPSVE
mmetsp:Transcript_10086/g.21133  ORF Transcript_10086/g.21133 Transcript_10086/m.21133 type:complete len:100 (+) Transcript_10086:131-430(+)|eukprot:CAMPEP_0201238572 /NCGR_PEP_ID=MMETSP0852-20130820/19803_1 /ASSEMBLY_ACC=CAM_ASM_000632 /TAXON_ID=183588 /ORGANISM="Pseudo-nitzschia fraudulenta, Strain WWA7" /LENGTH=99 /DNA_ID=CAMNT_0047533551 /DNA_START=81 /DNA_END=380 /DNA_ORIENTATION=-